jgi:hypothetical protein
VPNVSNNSFNTTLLLGTMGRLTARLALAGLKQASQWAVWRGLMVEHAGGLCPKVFSVMADATLLLLIPYSLIN